MYTKTFCTCSGISRLIDTNKTIIKEDSTYGWVLNWIELTEDDGYTQVHRYGMPILFCPMCGMALEKL